MRPANSEKHFIVTLVVTPDPPESAVEWIEIEAVHSGATRRIRYRELRDEELWRQGWV